MKMKKYIGQRSAKRESGKTHGTERVLMLASVASMRESGKTHGTERVLMLASVASMIDQFNMHNIRLMQELGYEVHVMCNFREGNTCDRQRLRKLRKALRDMSVQCHQWDCPREIFSPGKCCRAYRQFLELTRQYHFAWMHCHSPIGGALARLAAHRQGIRVIYTAHGFHFYKGAPPINWLLYYPPEKLLSYWTDVLITVNKEDYRFAKRNLGAENIYQIPGVGIEIQQFQKLPSDDGLAAGQVSGNAFRKKYQIPEDAVCMLSVGELSRRKNHQMVISAIAALQRPDICYLICGQGKLEKKLTRQAEALGVAGQVKMLGYQENMVQIYQNADIFVFPSLQEGMPAALMEAMAAGLPCVVSDIRGNRELITDTGEKGGIRFSPGRQDQLQDALLQLIGQKQLRDMYGRKNQNKIRAYRSEAVDKRMKQIYTERKQEFFVSVLIAVCDPNLEWLEQLLSSINRQTFPDYEVLLMDDGSEPEVFPKIQEAAAKSLDRQERIFLYRSVQNEGSDKTFEKLVLLAKGNYLAFCDQDDIWEKEKLECLTDAVRKKHAVMAYSDMSVIDENGTLLYPGMKKMRRCLRFVQGNHVTAKYLAENCTAGCSMLARADLVRKAVPFSRQTYCDQWVAACLSAYGRVVFVDKPLVRYRRHGGNQTGSLRNIKGKQDYYNRRVLPMVRLTEELKSRGISFRQEKEAAAFAKARKDQDIWGIWKYRNINRKYAYFDLLMICMPDALAKALLYALRNGRRQ